MVTRSRRWTTVVLALALALIAAGCAGPTISSDDKAPATVGKDLVFGPYVTAVSPSAASVHWISPPGVGGKCHLAGATSVVLVQESTSSIVGSPKKDMFPRLNGRGPIEAPLRKPYTD